MYKEILKWCGFLLTIILATNYSFGLINLPSTSALVCGLGLTIALVLLCVWFLTPYYRKLFKTLIIIPLLITGCTRVDPGYVGIVIGYYGSARGVADMPLKTGMVIYNPLTKSVLRYPTFVQTAVWTKDPHEGSPLNEEISFNTMEGMVINGDISLSYQLEVEKVPAFYIKFRSDDLDKFTHTFMRNIARDAFNEIGVNYTLEQAYGQKKEELVNKVKERIRAELAPYGVTIIQFGYIGAPRLPTMVVESLNAKIRKQS